ncbi:2,3-diaminopropionate biosynthesis protein SbnA (plasmid) [Brasilonema octagenarum UFV-E1]|uniref:N-(2-amino-2-carboxyethyl)-L-glutamate synthase n=2 Tax=Brasilonema TaxID=383614 RepID=A0A856MQM1_9CYAN|nr:MULTISPECIES: 2,3-diaminopropionate biosynthesis protein SbnA [Brasilonema]NMF61667.1 2,3-diaminopropionate biosynthesis protein SbnA [Brasilonema octagenarum UFV-OR1]QDL12604.1 2,3-diaminopropionate biosynthesis protein SbnA [Brasilonema sennae CENA114]QDL18999.1 2,3-diaminopropionate biosynthesis protein SbnA [Brasilonema octagenarum UFV-E1]
MIYESVASCVGQTPLVRLRRLFPQADLDIIAKLEFLNPGGSVKDRPARFIVEKGLQDGTINSRTHLVESTSGNLGIALAMMARVYKLSFTCVVDPKISPTNLQILQQLGANVDMVTKPDDQGGYLKTRIQRVQELVKTIPHSLWINQYANQLNWQAHYNGIGGEIIANLDGGLDCVVIAVSTTGTILGVARRLREKFPNIRVIAVDAVGSVIFGAPAGKRELPGIGSSRVPELLNKTEIDEIVYVDDWESMQGCRDLVTHEGIFAGGSSGSVVAAIKKLLPTFPKPYRVLTVFPDRGERYLDLVYNDDWVTRLQRLTAVV